ncbi:carboxylating nicotinate-nucleotide diphosphorylase [Pararhodonellum marinum]|uniref:carboxylating nicotinate-nucleotide diphosphorylase n=1 Tax=Pararhodonellum marinum TaxID=2755358 RepID=UPI001890A892|nr:carboxylating nicotinate-nucleotide diphosphorylase [Pararhodonellum marinum]
MKKSYLSAEKINEFITRALQEDVGEGDHSTLASIPKDANGQAQLIIKESGIIAGLELAEMIFNRFDPDLSVELLMNDGDRVKEGNIGLRVKGRAASILTSERLVLNCLQRMSGIATKTARLTEMIAHTKARLMDTRKTTPNFRMMEKWAVVLGGGLNHRFALYDMVMLKDNHIDFAGGISKAIQATLGYLKEKGLDLKIEVETRNLSEVRQVLREGGIHVIMLDNMSYEDMRAAVKMIDGEYKTEASGGITEATISKVAECGVDFISVGALTHHVKSMDISLKAY